MAGFWGDIQQWQTWMVWTTSYFNPTKQLVIAPKPDWLGANGSEIEHNAVKTVICTKLVF